MLALLMQLNKMIQGCIVIGTEEERLAKNLRANRGISKHEGVQQLVKPRLLINAQIAAVV